MKNTLGIILVFLFFSASAQIVTSKIPPLDKSPMDMKYYPVNFPILKIQGKIMNRWL